MQTLPMQGKGVYQNVGKLKTQIGQPDLIILFTSTVAHKMVHCALKEAETSYQIRVERSHSSSASALENVLQGCT